MIDLSSLSKQAVLAAKKAGKLISLSLNIELDISQKETGSTLASQVVTEVDCKSQNLILEILRPSCKEFSIAVLAEEEEDNKSRLEHEYFWCIDPLDGTLPFIEGKPGYAVSIGLVSKCGKPQIGVIYDPFHETLYEAVRGQGVKINNQPWNLNSSENQLTFTYDRSFADHKNFCVIQDQLEIYAHSIGLEGLATIQYGGAVLNACHALEKSPGCHFKLPKAEDGGGSLWDYAATACLYEESGAVVCDVFGNPLDLNRPDSTFMNHRGALYATDLGLAQRIRKIISGISHKV